MKGLLLFLAIFFIGVRSNDRCSPVRPMVSDMMENKADFDFVRGYFLAYDGSEIKLAQFKVLKATGTVYETGKTYPVSELGPFGNDCEVYEMGASPLADEFCGIANERYLIVYKNEGGRIGLVTPIFHSYGLTIDMAKDEISDQYAEKASLSDFENYIVTQPTAIPKWEKIPE
ncbi:hypothetical protein N9954_02850 [Maribacter sp.]|nr:hypothetical protein [Maribacter sp.]